MSARASSSGLRALRLIAPDVARPAARRCLHTRVAPGSRGPSSALICLAAGAGIASTLSISRPVLADAPPAPAQPKDGRIELEFRDTIEPRSLGGQRLDLVGLGIRVVSFLRVRAAGLYVDPSALRQAASLPQYKALTRDQLLASEAESLLRGVLDRPSDVAVRVVPTRATDWAHLRDGWCRAIATRLKIGTKSGRITDAEAEAVSIGGIDTLKAMFAKGQVAKGTEILLIRRGRDGALLVECGGELLGNVPDPVLSRELMLAYVSADNVISNALRQSVVEGFAQALGL